MENRTVILLKSQDGMSAHGGAADRLREILSKVRHSGSLISDSIANTVRSHFSSTYPGSQHWSPSKVSPLNGVDGIKVSGGADIDVPGTERAYHDITIIPRLRQHLTIPMSSLAKGKKASDFDNLFLLKKKNGNEFLARRDGKGLAFVFFLAKSAFQRRDEKLMPSDETIASNIFSRINAYLAS